MTKYEGSPMILSAALMHGLGIHLGAWMAREGDAGDYVSGDFYRGLARTAEAGKLHALFLAEQITNQENGVDRPCGTLDTGIALSFMAAETLSRAALGNHPQFWREWSQAPCLTGERMVSYAM